MYVINICVSFCIYIFFILCVYVFQKHTLYISYVYIHIFLSHMHHIYTDRILCILCMYVCIYIQISIYAYLEIRYDSYFLVFISFIYRYDTSISYVYIYIWFRIQYISFLYIFMGFTNQPILTHPRIIFKALLAAY